ncbi:MAG: GrdX family protein [Oscillospiraceae bacterium]|nr:GrdX family protein [Oscillospiraceae bacterium]
MDVIVTNNPLVSEKYKSRFRVDFSDTDLMGVFIHTRDLVHKGYILQTHPLTGGVKPNETFYKTVLLSEASAELDLQSLKIIEETILTAEKFTHKNLPEQYKNDMQVVDLSLISPVLEARAKQL